MESIKSPICDESGLPSKRRQLPRVSRTELSSKYICEYLGWQTQVRNERTLMSYALRCSGLEDVGPGTGSNVVWLRASLKLYHFEINNMDFLVEIGFC